jgi:TonB-linked SusC/RagA family outer membrane protein
MKTLLRSCMLFLLMASAQFGWAQNASVKGIVHDEHSPLFGASVLVKGTTFGITTDAEGKFSLPISFSGKQFLVISYTGYKSKEIAISSTNGEFIVGDVYLEPISESLNEVVVTALGIKREKKRLGFSVQEVQGDLTKARNVNALNSLSGKVSGLIIANSSEFFSSPRVALRGKNTLIVVDGVPLGTSSWNISPDDIETMTVLKGANAGALYGADGANGAIQITTKRGTKDARGFVIELNHNSMIQAGFNAIPKVQHSYGPGSYGNYSFKDGKGGGINDADYDQWGPKFEGQLIAQYDSPLDTNGNPIPTPWTNRGKRNFENFIENGLLETTNLALASKFENGSIRFSTSHVYQKGINPNTKLNIVNYNLSGTYDFDKKTSVNASANFNFQTSPNNPNVSYGPNSYIYNMLIWGGSDYDVRDLRDYWQKGKEGIQQKNFEYTRYNNPYFMAYEWLKGYYRNDFSGQLNLTHKFTKDFNVLVRSNLATNNLFQDEKFPYSATTYGREKGQGDYKENYDYNMNSYSDLMFNYKKKINDFEVSTLVGTNLKIVKTRSSQAKTDYLIVPGLYTLSNSQTPVQPISNRTHYETYGLYGSADLSYKNFMYLGLTGRWEKDSRLPQANNAFFYPSASLSTVLSSLFTMPEMINFFKLRASWAKVGTSLTDIYSNLDTYSLGTPYTIGGTSYNPVSVNSILSNPDLKPAFNSSTEFGFDADMFDNKFGFNVTYFINKNGPRIFNLNYSEASGYNGKKENGITTRTKGLEVALNSTFIKTKDFKWNMGINWSAYKEYLDEVYTNKTTGEVITNDGRIKVGERVDAFYVNDFMRSSSGQIIVGNNGKPVLDSYVTKLGYKNPDWVAGITNNFDYKNFTLSVAFDGRVGGKIENYVNRKLWQAGRHPDSDAPERANDVKGIKSYVADGVIVTGGEFVRDGQGNVIKDTRTYAANTTKVYYQDYAKSYYGTQVYNIIDKTFAKLREVSLTYKMPSSALKNTFINEMSMSLIGRDLFYFSKNKNIDLDQFVDEASSPLQTPTVKSFGVNINVKF